MGIARQVQDSNRSEFQVAEDTILILTRIVLEQISSASPQRESNEAASHLHHATWGRG